MICLLQKRKMWTRDRATGTEQQDRERERERRRNEIKNKRIEKENDMRLPHSSLSFSFHLASAGETAMLHDARHFSNGSKQNEVEDDDDEAECSISIKRPTTFNLNKPTAGRSGGESRSERCRESS